MLRCAGRRFYTGRCLSGRWVGCRLQESVNVVFFSLFKDGICYLAAHCVTKTPREGAVVESIGSKVDAHVDPRRGLSPGDLC